MGEVSETHGTVRVLENGYALVQADGGGCGRCHEKGGCGGQHLTQMFCATQKTYRVRSASGVAVGDKVVIAIPASAVRRSASLAYSLPVAGLIGGAGVGMLAGEIGSMFGALAGLVGAWLVVRSKTRPGLENDEFQPYIICVRAPMLDASD